MSTGTETQIALRHVTKNYVDVSVLDAVNLTIHRGQIVVFVGRSGSGKSTLLRIIGGLERPCAGAVVHAGRDIAAMTERDLANFRRHSLGFVFQFFNLIPTLSVSENIQLPLALLRTTKRLMNDKIAHLLEELEIGHCADRFPEELSGGEQQRVAIARALVHEPSLVIADEPTGNLDLETASKVLELLDRSCRNRRMTLIMATHSNEVIGIADRVLRINNCQIEAYT
jgi:putative ABC transport system ATP-binding protein